MQDAGSVGAALSRNGALDEYLADLRIAIQQEVVEYIERTYSISKAEGGGQPGCHTAASWN
eukprot:17971-Rhodomonas_salina.1